MHRAEVDELQRITGEHDVVRFEVAVDQALAVQIAERREDAEDVGDGLGHRQRVGPAAGGFPTLLEQLQQGHPADVLHHDVTAALPLHETEDFHDVAVVDRGEEPAFGDGRGRRLRVMGVEQALEHDPEVLGDAPVTGEVHPALTAERQAAGDLVLADDIPGRELRHERERMPAFRAETFQ